jgi:hypothetical protein
LADADKLLDALCLLADYRRDWLEYTVILLQSALAQSILIQAEVMPEFV